MKSTIKSVALASFLGLSSLMTGCRPVAESIDPLPQAPLPPSAPVAQTNNNYHMNREMTAQVDVTSNKDLPHRVEKMKVADEFLYFRQMPLNHPFLNSYITNLAINTNTVPATLETNLVPAFAQLDAFPFLFNNVSESTPVFNSEGRTIDLETTGLTYMPIRTLVPDQAGKLVPGGKVDLETRGKYGIKVPQQKMPTSTNALVKVVQTQDDIPFQIQNVTYNFENGSNSTSDTFYAVRYPIAPSNHLKHLLVSKDGVSYALNPSGQMSLRGKVYELASENEISNRIHELQYSAGLSNNQVRSSFDYSMKPKKAAKPKGISPGSSTNRVH